MTLSLVPCLVAGAILVTCGALIVAWRRERGTAISALPLLAGGAAVCVAAAGRFAAHDQPEAGAELAVLVCLVGLAATLIGAAWTREEA